MVTTRREPRDKVVYARIDSATHEALHERAVQEDRSVSNLVRLMIADYLQRNGREESD